MFEFDKYEEGKHSIPPTIPTTAIPPLKRIEKAAFLLWGEHCIECAAPDCYKTCDLYVQRPDGRCRRFHFGIYKNRSFSGIRGPGAEIVFGRWAKIEARGNARLIEIQKLKIYEVVALQLSSILNTGGKFLTKMFSDPRWSYLSFALSERLNTVLRKMTNGDVLDGFLIDAYNPTKETLTFLLTIGVSIPELKRYISPDLVPRSFQKRIIISPGHHYQLIDYSEFRTIIDSSLPFNIALTPQSGDGYHIIFRSLDLVKLCRSELLEPESEKYTPADPVSVTSAGKCVVFDLDNTLWEGVLLETDDVKLRPCVPELLQKLDEKGILLSLASKNAYDHAIAKLREFGIDEYFLFPKINWNPKSENIKQIAKDIDIGLDTFIFVDDNPFELDEVSKTLPSVECIDVSEIETLLSHPRLKGSTSEEARSRRKMYQASMVRKEVESTFGTDYTKFLKSSEIRLLIRPDCAEDFERIAELVQRTNQLNFSGHKYTRDELLKLFEDPLLERYVLICEDKFGQYGTIGFCMARRNNNTVRVEDLMLSCRVQGKFIESALFAHLCAKNGNTASRIEINFKKTNRNMPAQQVLAKLGFDIDQLDYLLSMEVTSGAFDVDFIQICYA